MIIKNIAIVTSKQSWFVSHAKRFVCDLNEKYNANIFFSYEDISNNPDVVFILSYFKIIKENLLKKHKHNLVVHGSDLPKGKGWAPLFWQILEGKNELPIVLFEAVGDVDAGQIYIKDYIALRGDELHDEIRRLQAEKMIEMCKKFLSEYDTLVPQEQSGTSTFYDRRTSNDSELDINKSIKDQFNLLRIVNNQDYPAFFVHNGSKYILKISKESNQKKIVS